MQQKFIIRKGFCLRQSGPIEQLNKKTCQEDKSNPTCRYRKSSRQERRKHLGHAVFLLPCFHEQHPQHIRIVFLAKTYCIGKRRQHRNHIDTIKASKYKRITPIIVYIHSLRRCPHKWYLVPGIQTDAQHHADRYKEKSHRQTPLKFSTKQTGQCPFILHRIDYLPLSH